MTDVDGAARKAAAALIERAPTVLTAINELLERADRRWWHRFVPGAAERARRRRAGDVAATETFLDRVYGGDQTNE